MQFDITLNDYLVDCQLKLDISVLIIKSRHMPLFSHLTKLDSIYYISEIFSFKRY